MASKARKSNLMLATVSSKAHIASTKLKERISWSALVYSKAK